eukprot:scaffold184822_cov15-Tisochrysis_lutea.AAC.2
MSILTDSLYRWQSQGRSEGCLPTAEREHEQSAFWRHSQCACSKHAYASWIMSVLVFLGCGQVREWCMRLFSGVDSAGQADACAGGA